MQHKFIHSLASFALTFFVGVIFAHGQQASISQPIDRATVSDAKTISGGVVNGKASNLAKPVFPPAAKAAHASGTVLVQVLIDESGNVVSAEATSGHPLLRAASVQAARESKFSPTTLEGKPVKVSGVIVYNFVVNMSLSQIGFNLAAAKYSSKFDESFPAISIAFSIQSEWTDEKQQADLLASKQGWDKAQKRAADVKETRQKDSDMTKIGVRAIGSVSGVVTGSSNSGTIEVKESYQTLVDSLTNLIKNRLITDETKEWIFTVSLTAGKSYAEINDKIKLLQNLDELKKLAVSAPSNVSQNFVDELQQMSSIANDGEIDAADKEKIATFFLRFR